MKSKHCRKLLMAALAAVAAMALMAPMAQAATPAAGYTQFTGCPSPAENSLVTACLRSVITGGHFQMGSKDVPITNPMTLRGGLDANTGLIYANAQGGLLPAKQKVPGGVVGLTGLTWLLELLGSDALTLYAQTELAGQPRQNGATALELPIRVHLINPTLGNNCYVGSFTNPIKLKLNVATTNPPLPNKPITGKEAEVSFDGEKEILHLDNGQFVDNSFAAPGATGCTLTLFGFIPVSINNLVNAQSGLPAPAGTNETRQDFDTEITDVHRVYP
jgi:hypothetical protein